MSEHDRARASLYHYGQPPSNRHAPPPLEPRFNPQLLPKTPLDEPPSRKRHGSRSPDRHDDPYLHLDPEQRMQITHANKFTPSCSRCRLKKLKCDTRLPCNQCTSKGLQNECRKDQRIPRGRKRPKIEGSQQEDELTALKRRIRELERIVEQQGSSSGSHSSQGLHPLQDPHFASSSSSSQRNTSSGASSIWRSDPSVLGQPPSRPTSPFTDVEEAPGETETAVVMLEKLAASDPHVGEPGHGRSSNKKINDPRSTQIGLDTNDSYFQQPAAFAERVQMLEHAKQILPEPMIIKELIDIFNIRCHHLVGHVINIHSLMADMEMFHSLNVVEIMTSHLDMFDLARFLMVLRLGMRFYPWRNAVAVDPTRPEFIATDALKNRGDDISQQWYDLAKRSLAVERSFSLGSLKAVQAALLMILDGRDSPMYLRMLLRISIQTALDMGLHRLGSAMPQPNDVGEDLVTIETGVRIWWYLVVKDWCSAQREGSYTIHPSQMTTRRPLNTNDNLLVKGIHEELPSSEHTEMSYVLAQISLAHVIRESIDLRNEQSQYGGSYAVMSPINRKRMQVKLENFLNEDLPPFFRLHSTRKTPGVLPVQRSLLHQQSFDVLLKLNRKDLSSPYGREALTQLAVQIISTQKLVRSICPVIDGFWINFLHLFGATLTLTISLLLDQDLDEAMRAARKEKVLSALATMRETPGSDRGSRIIETLIEEEERVWERRRRGRRGEDLEKNLATLTQRLVNRTADLGPMGSATVDDGVPEESMFPAFCALWGEDPCDPSSLLQQTAPAAAAEPRPPIVRPYKHSLHPWNEPSRSSRYDGPDGPYDRCDRPLPFHLIGDQRADVPVPHSPAGPAVDRKYGDGGGNPNHCTFQTLLDLHNGAGAETAGGLAGHLEPNPLIQDLFFDWALYTGGMNLPLDDSRTSTGTGTTAA
ncbi:hypothetical protein ACQY0O_004329 [Thecaphora frezii]